MFRSDRTGAWLHSDDDLAELVPITQVEARLLRLVKRIGRLDHRLDLVLAGKAQHLLEVDGIAHLAADNAGPLQEYVGRVELHLVARRRAVDHEPRAGTACADIIGKAAALRAVENTRRAAGKST